MTYSLWETESANIVGTFSTEAEALALVHELVGSTGMECLDSFSLTKTAENGSVEGIAAGPELVAMARQRATTIERRPSAARPGMTESAALPHEQ